MKKYIHIFLCLTILLAGCAKKKNNTTSKNLNNSKKTQIKNSKKSIFDENLEAFALDDDALHNFAHDKNTTTQTEVSKDNTMFAWQNATVDQSKEDFKTIYFEFDKYIITDEQEAALQANIEYALKMIGLGKFIIVEGHACDSAGSRIYNTILSEKRAKFIANKLINAGIDKHLIKIAARGQDMPVHKGGNKHQQAVNRRVEIFAIDSK